MSSLNSHVTVLAESLRALERVLDGTRGQWDDSARRTFDRHYGDPLISNARRDLEEMQQLADQLASAIRTLHNLR
jgi:uncharacterized protein with von Willebrand factor type A (vWA) domain